MHLKNIHTYIITYIGIHNYITDYTFSLNAKSSVIFSHIVNTFGHSLTKGFIFCFIFFIGAYYFADLSADNLTNIATHNKPHIPTDAGNYP